MYENQDVTERHITVVFTYASDDASDAAMHEEIVGRVNALATSAGCDVEILSGDMLAR